MFHQKTCGQESVSCQELGVSISKYGLHEEVGLEKRQRFDVHISEGCGVGPLAKHIRGTYREKQGKRQ